MVWGGGMGEDCLNHQVQIWERALQGVGWACAKVLGPERASGVRKIDKRLIKQKKKLLQVQLKRLASNPLWDWESPDKCFGF